MKIKCPYSYGHFYYIILFMCLLFKNVAKKLNPTDTGINIIKIDSFFMKRKNEVRKIKIFIITQISNGPKIKLPSPNMLFSWQKIDVSQNRALKSMATEPIMYLVEGMRNVGYS